MSLISVTTSFRAAAAVGAAAAVTTSSALRSSILALARWGRADEGIVNVEGLFEELGSVEVLDGFTRLGES